MNRKTIALLALTGLLLTGCSRQPAPTEAVPSATAAPTETVPATTAAPTETVPAATAAPTETIAAETLAAEAAPTGEASPYPGYMLWETSSMSYCGYHVTSEYWMGEDHFTLFSCRDQSGQTVWQQEAPHHNGGAQLSPTWPLGIGDDKFFYYHDGVVTALELTTGETLWQSPNTGICLADTAAALVDPEGFICLAEYFDSRVTVLDFDGNILREIPTLDPDLYWTSSLTRRGDELVLHLDGGGTESLYGTDLTVPMDWIP